VSLSNESLQGHYTKVADCAENDWKNLNHWVVTCMLKLIQFIQYDRIRIRLTRIIIRFHDSCRQFVELESGVKRVNRPAVGGLTDYRRLVCGVNKLDRVWQRQAAMIGSELRDDLAHQAGPWPSRRGFSRRGAWWIGRMPASHNNFTARRRHFNHVPSMFQSSPLVSHYFHCNNHWQHMSPWREDLRSSEVELSAMARSSDIHKYCINLHRARLVLRWVTMSGFNSRCRTFISVYKQPPRSTQPGHPSQRAMTLCGWGVKADMVRVWVAGQTVRSPYYTWDISERYINSPFLPYIMKIDNGYWRRHSSRRTCQHGSYAHDFL